MSQETERYQLENNGNTYLVRTPAGSGGGADVEANPEGTATEDLEKLQVGETIYGLPPVVGANPVLAGTEPALTGLQIGDTKYAVPEGYEINTYQPNKIYTSADSNYEQLRKDITNNIPIKIGYRIFICEYIDGNTRRYISIYNNGLNTSNEYKVIDVMVSTNQISLGAVNEYTHILVSGLDNEYSNTTWKTLNLGGVRKSFSAQSTNYLTTAPTADNTDGLKIVVLSSEPATYYNGYYYIIAPST